MGRFRPLGQSVHSGCIPGCERFGHAWAVPEDAMKPDRLPPGIKPKQLPSSGNSEKEK